MKVHLKKDTLISTQGGTQVSAHCSTCLIHQLAFCAPLEADQLESLDNLADHQSLAAGSVLYREGDRVKYFYTVVEGTIRLTKILPDGRRYITGFVLAGDFIGLFNQENYSHTAEAITDVRLCVFEKSKLQLYMKEHPVMRDRLLEMTESALEQAYSNQLLLGRLTPLEKTSRFLVDLYRRSHRNGCAKNMLPIPMNRTDIADHLGLTIETVSRCFSKLKTQSVIRLKTPSQIEILDHKLLHHMAALTEESNDAGTLA